MSILFDVSDTEEKSRKVEAPKVRHPKVHTWACN